MPLVRIDLRRGKSAAYKKAISDGIYRALREIFTVPENDRFMVLTNRGDEDFIYEPRLSRPSMLARTSSTPASGRRT